eukprot:100633_1
MSHKPNNFACKLHIGRSMDMFVKKRKTWIIVQIVDRRTDRLKIHIYGSDKRDNTWILMDDAMLAPLNTHTLPMEILQPPQTQMQKPLLHICNDEASIVIPSCTYNNMIAEYDLKNDEWTHHQMRCGSFIQSQSNHSNACCIDNTHSILHMIGESEFIQICLDTGYTNHSFCYALLNATLSLGYGNRNTTLFECIDHRLHVIDLRCAYNQCHLMYNTQSKRWTQCTDKADVSIDAYKYEAFEVKKTLYVASIRSVLIFCRRKQGNPKHRIYYGAICSSNGSIDWTVSDSVVNNIDFSDLVDICVMFERLLFVVCWNSKTDAFTYAFLDVISGGWFDCDKCVPVTFHEYMVNTNDNFVHFMSSSCFDKANYHFKINVIDLIPKALDVLYRNSKYKQVVYAYINQSETTEQIPLYLSKLVLNYVPCFYY